MPTIVVAIVEGDKDAGTLSVGGYRYDAQTGARSDLGKYVGYLPQDTELFSGTVRDNIARFRPNVSDSDVIWAAETAGAHQLILRLQNGYDTELDESGQALSAGQRQRVGLARAILGKTRLVVLDEPNAALDAEGEAALMKAIDALKASGKTLVVISHKPSILEAADKILVLRDGRMEVFGPKAQVMARFTQAPPSSIEAAG